MVSWCKLYFNVEGVHNVFVEVADERISVVAHRQTRATEPGHVVHEGGAAVGR